jgi:hypothetical protein
LTSVFFWVAVLLMLYVALYWIERKPHIPSLPEIPPTGKEGSAKLQGL